jgi:hypothetical protein
VSKYLTDDAVAGDLKANEALQVLLPTMKPSKKV